MAEQDYYQLLGVPRDATVEEIKQAHRSLVREIHPDRSPDDPDAEQRFMRVQEAYEILSDPEKREAYDSGWGRMDKEHYDVEAEAEAADLDTVFGAVFGSRRPKPPKRKRRFFIF